MVNIKCLTQDCFADPFKNCNQSFIMFLRCLSIYEGIIHQDHIFQSIQYLTRLSLEMFKRREVMPKGKRLKQDFQKGVINDARIADSLANSTCQKPKEIMLPKNTFIRLHKS